MASCAACPQSSASFQPGGPSYGGYMEVQKPHQIQERQCYPPPQQPPFCPPQEPPCYEPPSQRNCPPEMQYGSSNGKRVRFLEPNSNNVGIPPNCYCSPSTQPGHQSPKSSTLPYVSQTDNKSTMMQLSGRTSGSPSNCFCSSMPQNSPSKCACPENLLPKPPMPQKEPSSYKGMPAYCSYLAERKPKAVEEPLKERELLHTSRMNVDKYCPKKPCSCIPSLPTKDTKITETASAFKCPCDPKIMQLAQSQVVKGDPCLPEIEPQKYNPQFSSCPGIYSDIKDGKPCPPYLGSEEWGPNAFKRPEILKLEDHPQPKAYYGSKAATCIDKCPGNEISENLAISKDQRKNSPPCIPQCPGNITPPYDSQVCDTALELAAERERKIYKESPQHQCKVINRDLPERYPPVLCYCPLEKQNSSKLKTERLCASGDNPECMCRNFKPGQQAMKEMDRAMRCPQGKPDCVCPPSKLKDIDPCTGDIKKEEMGQTSIMAVPGGSSCYMPQSDLNEPSGPVTSTKEGVTCYCPELSPQSQNAAYLPQPENRSVAAHTACQPDPCVCDIPPCQSQQQQQQGGKPPPCVLPQLRDMFPKPERVTAEGQEDQKMGVIGPWATGRVDWGPLSDLTGTRPVVDKYTITRYSDGEWRKHNADVLGGAEKEVHHANVVDFNGRQCASFTAADTDKKQNDNTRRLSQRAHDVHRYKVELEHAIMAMADEINMMERQRQQLKTAMGILRMPESIAGECLDRRATRLEPDLVRDKAEEELVKERSLIGEIRDLMERMLKQMEEQLKHDKAVKSRTEMDWSDKKEAYEIEATNVGLRNTSTTLLFRPGAARFPDGQSTPESWEEYTKESLSLLKAELDRSVELRHFLESFLADMARDLRMQADRVDTALAMKIAETNEIRMRLENELLKTLRRIADTERLIADLKQAIRNQDAAMKKAQTRLDNRLLRPRQENCRDIPQYGLIDEVKSVSDSVSALKAQLKQAEESLQGLLTTRGDLEREIIVKRKSLFIDRDRCQEIRSHYPSTVALTGH